jgi:membrane protease YdiL (CAAX protease family)
MKKDAVMKGLRLIIGILLPLPVVGLGMVLVTTVGRKIPVLHSDLLPSGVMIQVAMFAVAFCLIAALSRGRLAEYGFQHAGLGQLKTAFIFGSVVAVIVHVVIAIVWTLFPPAASHPALAGSSFIRTVFTVWIVASTSEEVVHRGLIQSFLKPLAVYGVHIGRIRLSLPVIVAAVLFGVLHIMLLTMGADGRLVGGIVATAIVLGVVAGYYREKTGSLMPAILIHMLFNVYGSASEYIQRLVSS